MEGFFRRREIEEEHPRRIYEDFAYVLDFLPHGRFGGGARRMAFPTAQLIGELYFTLLEVELRPNARVYIQERLYIGRGKREKVLRVLGRLSYEELTANAKAELLPLLERMVVSQERRFVEFFNRAQAITQKTHSLELLPGIGKKLMWQMVAERERDPFSSFKDIQERTSLSDPVKVIARRIVEELEGKDNYRLFVRAP